MNWAIGSIGDSVQMSRPFDSEPKLAEGTFDSSGKPVEPRSLYLAQLKERLGTRALKNIGYSSPEIGSPKISQTRRDASANQGLGKDLALEQPVSASSVRDDKDEFAGDMALDGNEKTYWATKDGTTNATLEIDMDGPTEINSLAIEEAAAMTNRVQSYKVEGQVNSDWKLLSAGTTIGERKVDHFKPVTVWKVRFSILNATEAPAIRTFSLYLDDTINAPK
jgi:hypothetical protein